MRLSRASLTRRPAALGVMAAAFLCVLLGGRDAAVAQLSMSEADKEVLRNYELTIPKIDKLEAVATKLVAAAKADPQVRKELGVLGGQFQSIDALADMVSRLAPHFTAVLKAEGTDPHEFYVGLMSTVYASEAVEVRDAPGVEAKNAPGVVEIMDLVPAGNIAFARKHKPRLDYLSKVLSGLDKVDQAE